MNQYDPLMTINSNRESQLSGYKKAIEESRALPFEGLGTFYRGLKAGHKLALRQARWLLRDIRAKKRSGWHLVWVRCDVFEEMSEVFPPGGFYETKIE